MNMKPGTRRTRGSYAVGTYASEFLGVVMMVNSITEQTVACHDLNLDC